jgi:hypothetical protein
MASLTIVVDGAEQKFPLDSAAVTLGRGLESDIRLKDIKASRRHCQIVKTPKGYQCVDLSSGNGTYVNGVQIKSQLLDTGDKITVGSTTISFEAAGPATKSAPLKAVSTKAATAKIPLAAPPAPAPAKSATGKVATAKVPPAPTRKSTGALPAVKPASQGALKPATQPLSKSASRLGNKPTAATRGTRPRPAPPGPASKKSPVLLIGIAVAVLALGGGGAWFFFLRDGTDQVGLQINQLIKKAEAAEKEEKIPAAIADYRKALELAQGERYKYQARDITGRLKQLEARPGGEASPKPDSASKEPAEKGPDLQAKKAEIAEKHKLAGDPAAADWSGAVQEWADLAKGKVAGDVKSKIDAEIRAIHAKAKQDLDRLRKKAESLAQENKMAEAVDLLKQQKPRFEHTDLRGDLDAAIKQYDK